MTWPALDYGNWALREQWAHEAELEAEAERREELAREMETEAFRDASHWWLWRRLHGE